MSLTEEIQQIRSDFENTESEKILKIVDEIRSHFKSDLTKDYLQGKIKSISEVTDEAEKKKLCKTLLPYFDWYIQGL
ncbi:hypothetical protein NsoK4_03535 [Nitrosopumilus sp. K4]|uniref:hypothetical protein n=1 Tax=Nitrosopumilus sp. K4 TaxID=2795383 RepID=UPI001BAAC890|nr:hypothetical protein [Nitrosopumilus sp. K4]QUC65329.1 hypothetical protein NsoK4_03535 [Nitrosopumilus sp. K4]